MGVGSLLGREGWETGGKKLLVYLAGVKAIVSDTGGLQRYIIVLDTELFRKVICIFLLFFLFCQEM